MADKINITFDRSLQVVRVTIHGDLTLDDHQAIKQQVDDAALELEDTAGLFVLQDGRYIGKVDAATRRAMRSDLANDRQQGTAIFGVPMAQRIFMNALFRASGIRSIRFFDTEDDAIAWLRKRKAVLCS